MLSSTGQLSLWDIAVEESSKNSELSISSSESTLLVAGAKSSGKSSFLARLLERTDSSVPKQTLALEYTFVRRSNKTTLAREVCHVWELGGGLVDATLLAAPLRPEQLSRLAVVLVMDLSKPADITSILPLFVDSLRKALSQVMENVSETTKNTLMEAAWNRIGGRENHPDRDKVNPFPVTLLILGTKYDLLRDMPPEQVKMLCRFFRYIAHVNGASLLFTSLKDPVLAKRTRDAMSAMAFSGTFKMGVNQDPRQPLAVPPGADSIEAIGGGNVGLEVWTQHQMKTTFPTNETVNNDVGIIAADPVLNANFRERMIDDLRNQKDQELIRYREEVERRRKLALRASKLAT